MRSLKSGLFAIALSGLFGTVAVIGCSASGGDDGIGTGELPTEPTADPPAVLPPPSAPVTGDMDSGTKADANKKDAAPKPEAGVDAGPPPPVEGTACTTLNEIGKKNCGACGKAETVCLAGPTGNKWSAYGSCNNELVGGCVPGTTATVDCGNCGKQVKTCTQYCAYSAGACTGVPANSCVPTSIDYSTAGCTTAQTYRNRVCGATCQYGNYSATCDAPVNANKLTISLTAGTTPASNVSGNYTLSAAKVGYKVTGGCPGSVSATADFPYEVVEVKNPSATLTAKVSAWNSGTPAIDNVMAAYYTNLAPQTSAQVGACSVGVNDFCPSSLPCTSDDNWAGLTGTQQITIPPGQVVLIRFQSYYAVGGGSVSTGAATLTVRTDSLM